LAGSHQLPRPASARPAKASVAVAATAVVSAPRTRRAARRRPPLLVLSVEVRWLVLDTDVRLLTGSCKSADAALSRAAPTNGALKVRRF
jgi:hypothetical protein